MIEAYGVYEIKVIDSRTNVVKQEIVKKNKLTLAMILAMSGGLHMSPSSDYGSSGYYRLQSQNKRMKPERLVISNGTTQIAAGPMNRETITGSLPKIFSWYKRYSPPVSTQTHAAFYFYSPNYTNINGIVIGGNANFKYGNFNPTILSSITLTTPCVQTTTDYLDVTYKLSITYSTNSSEYIVDKVKDYSYNTFANIVVPVSGAPLGIAVTEIAYATTSFFTAPNNTSAYRECRIFQSNTKPIRQLSTVTMRQRGFQGFGEKISYGNTHYLTDALTYRLVGQSLSAGIAIGSIFNSISIQRYADRGEGWPGNTYFKPTAFVSLFPINKFHSPVFKHAYGCNGPFQDLNYLGTSSGTLAINSSSYTKKEMIPIFRRVDLRGSGNIASTNYSYKDMNVCAFPSWDGNYSNTVGYFGLAQNTNVSTGTNRYLYSADYYNSNPGIPGLANAYAQGVSGDPYPEWNNNIDDSEQWYRSDFVTNTGEYRIVKRNPWSGETLYSTDNSSLVGLSNVKQTAFNTITKEFWIASSTNGLWKVSDNFTTATQIDLSSYDVASAQVYAVCINSTVGIVYVMANGGLLKSTDNGTTWTKYTELNGLSINELNGVGGAYSNCASLVCSNIYDTDLLINAKVSGTQHKIYRWNGSTVSVYHAPVSGYYVNNLQFTSKRLPNTTISLEEDLVIYEANQRVAGTNNLVYIFINKYNESLYEVYRRQNTGDYDYALNISLRWYSARNDTVIRILPIKILNNIFYYFGFGDYNYANASSIYTYYYYMFYNAVSNVVLTPSYHQGLQPGAAMADYIPGDTSGIAHTVLHYGFSPALMLFNQKTKFGFFKNNIDPKLNINTWGFKQLNSICATPQIMPGTGRVIRPSAVEAEAPTTPDAGVCSIPVTMTNGIPRYMGRHLAWREYMWNGSSWVMDTWTPAVDSSGKGRSGERKFFDHGSRLFNSSSTISWMSETPITGTTMTFAISVKTSLYPSTGYNNAPLISTRNSASRLRTGDASTSFHYLWARSSTALLGIRSGYSGYSNTATTATYATNTWHRLVFVTTGTTTKFYVGGSLVDTWTHPSITFNIYELMLGAAYDFRNPTAFFEGELENFQCWNKEWTLDDVAYDYANQTGLVSDNVGNTLLVSNDLQIQWKLDENLVALECRPLHDSAQTIPKYLGVASVENDGVTIDFDNGVAGTSFVDNESMTFATLNGILKDNATTVTTPSIYQNFTKDVDESTFYSASVPSVPYTVTQLPIYWVNGGNYTFNQVVGPQGLTNPTASYSQLTFPGDFDFTFEPSCEVYNNTFVGFTISQVSSTPTVKIYINFTASNTVVYIDGATVNVGLHTFGDVYRISKAGNAVTVYRGATLVASGTAAYDNMYAYVNFAHASDTYAGISNATATITLPAGMVLFGDKLAATGIWSDKDYNYSPEYYNLAAHAVTINGVLTTPISDGPNQYSNTIATIAATPTAGSPAVCKYGMIFHSADYGKTLGGTYRYRYIGI